ncbi:MAG: FtsQ-type POTRA domain-containing protein [Clostridia bacterium]|nr:FtsQ-type POTRA domain-containing protein [Clostridia bacterium]
MGTKSENKGYKRGRKLHKGRLAILIIAVVVLLLSVFAVLLRTVLFPVKNVTVTGNGEGALYTDEQIITAADLRGKPIMSVSAKKLEAALHKTLPYIETVKIKRVSLDSIEMAVTYAKERFAFTGDNGYYIAGENTRVLAIADELPENLVAAAVPGAAYKIGDEPAFKDDEQKELFKKLYTYCDQKGVDLNSIDLTDKLHIKLKTGNRFEVLLGNSENITEKIDLLTEMMNMNGERKGTINLEMWSQSNKEGTFIPGN